MPREVLSRLVSWWSHAYRRAPFISILPFCAVYTAYWFWLALQRFYSFHTAVYDLGIEMQGGWQFTQPSLWSTPIAYLGAVGYVPTRFVFSPVTIGADYPVLLLFQALALASGAVAVHLIARHHLGGNWAPFAFASAYLLYLPLAGLTWFDFHWEALFVPLFLFGYLLAIRRQYWAASILILLGGMTTYPYLILPALFGCVIAIEAVWPRIQRSGVIDRSKLWFAAILVVVSIGFLAYQTAYLSSFEWSSFVRLSVLSSTAHASGSSTTAVIPWTRHGVVLLLVLGPMMFLPIFSPKWTVMLLPFAGLVTLSSCWCYTYPAILQLQYGALAIPIVFAGGLEVLGRARSPPRAALAPPHKRSARIRYRLTRVPWRLPFRVGPRGSTATASSVLAIGVALALVFQPYGPLNQSGPAPFPLGQLEGNRTLYNEFVGLLGLVPRSSPYLLMQNDMAIALPRSLVYAQTPLTSSETKWVNATAWDAQENRFGLQLFNGTTVFAQIAYAIDNPQGPTFLAGASNTTMFDFTRVLYGSGEYGVLGEASGMLLLERGYVGAPQMYVPYGQYVPASALHTWQTNQTSGTPVIERSNVTDGRVWWGPFITLSPGNYTATMWLESSDVDAANSIEVQAVTNLGKNVLHTESISGSQFQAADTWQPFTINFTLNNTYNEIEIATWNANWAGTIAIEGIGFDQTAVAANPLD